MNEPTIRHEGEFVLVQLPNCLLCFTHEEWLQAVRRGNSISHNRGKMSFPLTSNQSGQSTDRSVNYGSARQD
jgi:hypothetical protein